MCRCDQRDTKRTPWRAAALERELTQAGLLDNGREPKASIIVRIETGITPRHLFPVLPDADGSVIVIELNWAGSYGTVRRQDF